MIANSFKKYSLLFLLFILFGLLAGCVQSSSDDGETTTEDGKTIINIGRMTSANPKFPEGDTYEDNAYTRLVEEKLDVEIRNAFEAEGEDYERQVALAISAGDLPDMMVVGSRDELQDLVDNDLVEDLTDVYEENASDHIREIYNTYDNKPLTDATFDDRLMAIPSTNGANAPQIVWVRSDWLKELNIELDADEDGVITLDELAEVASAFVENDPGDSGNPVGIPMAPYLNAGDYGGSAFTMNSIAAVFDGHPRKHLVEEDGSVTYGSTSEGTKEGLAVLHDWFEQGILDPQFGTRSFDDILTLLTNGQAGITTGPWHLPDWGLSTVREMDGEAEFAAYALGDENGMVNVFREDPTGSFVVIRKGYEHPELAIQMLNLFYGELGNEPDMETKYPEIAEYNQLGVDGTARPMNIEVYRSDSSIVNYQDVKSVIDGEMSVDDIISAGLRSNTTSVLEYLEDPENATTANWSTYHSRMLGWGLMNKLAEEDRFNWIEPAYVGTTPTMEQKGANLLKMEEEDFIKIITGAEPVDYFDTFVEKWHSQGGDDEVAEVEEELAKQE
ncbi:extracellular solute-binding protein [Gracilibacillus alcaliphilus]|uniref:extracellular solute-binding protein n=1 Tax=Gracilibacillus alcaliphilus TaxID=1401441 RepID=UPI00195C99D8|nr:extracellular solute-binding protein [Gracilibacillus alcaliphilus]MBM7678192.1 putative aldouronate transport system substrate-binding protein [Gracilibacillus alcaliphilus]